MVVCDRFLLANVVYQGYAGGLDVEDLWEVGRIATGGLLPDLTVVLDMPAETAAERLRRPLDRMEQQGAAFHEQVRQGFLREPPDVVLARSSSSTRTVPLTRSRRISVRPSSRFFPPVR